jgi:hypothetical protein
MAGVSLLAATSVQAILPLQNVPAGTYDIHFRLAERPNCGFGVVGYETGVGCGARPGDPANPDFVVSIVLDPSQPSGFGPNIMLGGVFNSNGGFFDPPNRRIQILEAWYSDKDGRRTVNIPELTPRYDENEAAWVRAYVPEPASWGMMVIGFGVLGAVARRRRSGETAATQTG